MTVKITGVKELDKAFESFEPKLQKKIGRKAARAAAKPVLESARSHVPIDFGTLHDSLKIKALKRSRKNKHIAGVRVLTGEESFKGETFYGAFIEFGTSTIQGRGFMRLAHDENRENVRQIFVNTIKPLIAETAREVG